MSKSMIEILAEQHATQATRTKKFYDPFPRFPLPYFWKKLSLELGCEPRLEEQLDYAEAYHLTLDALLGKTES